ncbi:hypothetical+protein [Methylocapsa aurea]|uniref:hypothetical protein n=1 Tax=Methylocapsa aurea TaxID=663610 RepID=UPI003D189695
MLGSFLATLAANLAAGLGGFFLNLFGRGVDALRAKRQDEDRVATHETAAVAEAAEETADVIADAADARSALPGAATDADDLARRLRGRKTGADGGH